MANLKASIKDVRKTKKRRARNIRQKSVAKQAIKDFKAALTSGDTAKAVELLARAQKTIDKATKNNAFHRNTAARKKSQLAKSMPR